jgi:hypothetical protein
MKTTTTKKNTAPTATKKAATPQSAKLSPEQQAEKLFEHLIGSIQTKYKVKLPLRQKRMSEKVGYACRELLGYDLQAKLRKAGKPFDWKKYNDGFFAKIFGEPDKLKYPPEVMVAIWSRIFNWISTDTEEGIAQLVEYNRQSQQKRNGRSQETDDEEIDDLDIGEIVDDDGLELDALDDDGDGDDEDDELDDELDDDDE